MIDIHTHVLPQIDDGAKDVDVAAAMLKEELSQGVRTVLLTSHYYGKRHSPARFLEKRTESFERLKPYIPEGIEVRLGAEVHFTGVNMPQFDALCKLAIEGTKYILIELPFRKVWSTRLMERLEDFIGETGYTPIIAHVERYMDVLKNPSLVTEFVKMGCLIQVNADSFWDKHTRGFTRALLKKGLVHCIGTDAHNLEERAPTMAKAKETLEKAGFSAAWDRSQEIMQNVLEGGQVWVETDKRVKKLFGLYF